MKIKIAARVLKRATEFKLSKRQLEVLLLCGEDRPRKQIADELGISLSSVSRHITMVHLKMRVQSTAAALTFLYR